MLRKFLAASIFCFFGITAGNGQGFPSRGEIYDFEPGDVFETIHYFCCNDVSFRVERRTIEEKIYFDGQNGYLTTLSRFELLLKEPYIIEDTILWQQSDTLWILYPDSVIFKPGDTVIQNPEWYNGKEVFIRKYFLLNALCEERYVKGCGMVYLGWGTPPSTTTSPQDSLSWYCKTDECWGNSLLILKAEPLSDAILIHPNPVADVLKVSKGIPMEIRSIRLTDLNGRVLRFADDYAMLNFFRINIPVAGLGTGMYLLSVETDRGTFIHKIIKL